LEIKLLNSRRNIRRRRHYGTLDSSEPFLHWDRNLSELSEAGEIDCVLYTNHFSELLDDLSHDALLGQLLSDPFLSGVRGGVEAMEGEDGGDLSPSSPLPPHITAEHSYSLCGDSRPQSPLSHLTGEHGSEAGESDGDSSEWPMEQDEAIESLLCETPSLLPTLSLSLTTAGAPAPEDPTVIKEENIVPQIKLEPHEVDQFLNLSPKGLESLQMPPTPPSSHGSDSEGSQSPFTPAQPLLPHLPHQPSTITGQPEVSPRTASCLSNSPLLTAPHKLQGSGPLILTEEERRTLVAEGYPVPTKLPLTKAEEKALKKIRRKIKNKISAQESRRKKKEYMDTLEKKSLLQQLQSLQAMVAGKIPKSCRVAGTQTSSCLMVVVLCFSLFLGSFYPSSLTPASSVTETGFTSKQLTVKDSYLATVKSRSLLSTFEEEQPHLLGLGGEYPDQWEDTSAVVMAAWRRSEQQKLAVEPGRVETHPLFRSKSNDTQTSKNLLMDMHRSLDQRANESSSKVIELERTVNETS
uniref:cAMP responsive element binding protein 3-like 2 n=1 Tax=Labrus bergylta TaxID=56723 RepID=A0A3Q3EFI2_9LABR